MADKKNPNDPFGIQAWLEGLRDENPARHLALHFSLSHAVGEMRRQTAPAIFQTFGAQLEEHLAATKPDLDLAGEVAPLYEKLLAGDLLGLREATKAPQESP